MSKNLNKRLTLFDQGAQAVAKYRNGDNSLYFCTICKAGYPKSAAETGFFLTLEHVPPKRIGGKELLLTCNKCNHPAGHTVDAALDRRTQVKEFLETISGKGKHHLRKTQLDMDGLQFTTELSRPGETTHIHIIQKANNPENMKKPREPHILADGDEIKLSISMKAYDKHAKLSDLRSAFLLITAWLGYSYAFHPSLDKVREQIRNPQKDYFGMKYWFDFPEGTFPLKSILYAVKPTFFYFVIFQHYGIVLPSLDSPPDLYDIFDQHQEKNNLLAYEKRYFQWPDRLMMTLDFDLTGNPDKT